MTNDHPLRLQAIDFYKTIQAWVEGKPIQFKPIPGKAIATMDDWDDIALPAWDFSTFEYRVKPDVDRWDFKTYRNIKWVRNFQTMMIYRVAEMSPERLVFIETFDVDNYKMVYRFITPDNPGNSEWSEDGETWRKFE